MESLVTPLSRKGSPSKKFVQIGLFLTIFFQLSVLCVEYLGAVWPIWTGKAVVLKTQPVDPRSLFRGNYVRLNYDISRVEREDAEAFKLGSVVYLTLEENSGLWQAKEVTREMPSEGDFIRGRVRSHYGEVLSIDYGIEAFFMPKEKALAVEKEMQGTGTAQVEVYISSSGKARAVGFICIAKTCGEFVDD
ncbi:GDYXXLXY domain-containing protein [Shewanella nanhaiensis]|uniref:GDYXXLXY domain-containing protein n=1 Tax=Shewanella nanhaiensis TaxID=2864872 RepID=A0ABS7E4V1_9GAMM|nr:GDYXXLXY domain-containing protein [Shewanella nanhaiensis]MBW8184706.1 GDYXXLXY domain-containing protein [Shewanella nanhaiensis]